MNSISFCSSFSAVSIKTSSKGPMLLVFMILDVRISRRTMRLSEQRRFGKDHQIL